MRIDLRLLPEDLGYQTSFALLPVFRRKRRQQFCCVRALNSTACILHVQRSCAGNEWTGSRLLNLSDLIPAPVVSAQPGGEHLRCVHECGTRSGAYVVRPPRHVPELLSARLHQFPVFRDVIRGAIRSYIT